MGEQIVDLPSATTDNSLDYHNPEEAEVSRLPSTEGTDGASPQFPRSFTIPAHNPSFADESRPSNSTTPPTLIPDAEQQPHLLTPPTTPIARAQETFCQAKAEKSPLPTTRGTEQESVINELKTPPSTPPTRPGLSLQSSFEKPQTSSGSSSERSINSTARLANQDPYSPITQRSQSSDHELELKPVSSKPAPTKQLPCLQCHLASLTCSLSGAPQRRRNANLPKSKLCCTRCARSGENFCILQVAVEFEGTSPPGMSNWGGKPKQNEGCDITYFAEKVNRVTVLEKAGEMLEARSAKTRFALPRPSFLKLEKLKPGFGWLVNGGREEWRKAQEVRFDMS